MRSSKAITFIILAVFFGTTSNAICSSVEYTDLVTLNTTYNQQADWMHEVPDLFFVDTASIKIVGSAAEFGYDTFKLWLHITDDATSNINWGEAPFFVTTVTLDHFDSIVIEEDLNDTQVGWLNGDGDIFGHLYTTNEFNQVVPGRYNFQVNASRLTAHGNVVPVPATAWLFCSGIACIIGLRKRMKR